MRNRRPVAVLICIFLLLGQWGSVLHAVEHFSTEIADSRYVFEHSWNEHPGNMHVVNQQLEHERTGHDRIGHEHRGGEPPGHNHAEHEHINSSVSNQDDRQGKKHGDLFCLVFHLHGNVQASMPAPIALILRNKPTVSAADVFTQAAIEATTIRLAIRAPPVIS